MRINKICNVAVAVAVAVGQSQCSYYLFPWYMRLL